MSVPNFVHGVTGISCPNWFFFSGHFLLDAAYFKQGWQLAMNCSMSLFIPGQYIVCFASSMHLVTPRCPVCSSFRNLSLITFGMIIHVDFRSRPFSTVSSSLNVQYGCASFGTSLVCSGHPVVTMCFNSDSLSSLAVSNLMS